MQARQSSAASPLAEAGADMPALLRRYPAEATDQVHRHHRHRRGKFGRAPLAFLAGMLAFLALLGLLQFGPGGSGLAGLDVDQLMGHIFWWPLALATLFGLSAGGVLVVFRRRNPDGKQDSELRHILGRRLAKLGFMGMFFFAGWLGSLFLASVALMIRG